MAILKRVVPVNVASTDFPVVGDRLIESEPYSTDQIAAIIAKSRQSGVVSPFIVHTKPLSMRPQHQHNKEHWTSITPDYLSKAFAKSRALVGVGVDLDPKARPTFHEIRSLGARIYREKGYSKEYVQHLMTYTDEKTTDIYLNDPGALKEQHFRQVAADLSLSDL